MKKTILLFFYLLTLASSAQNRGEALHESRKNKNILDREREKAFKNELDLDCAAPTNVITIKENEIFLNGKKGTKLTLKKKNVLTIELTKENDIIIEGKYVEIKDIQRIVEDFLNNGAGIGINGKPCDYCQGRKKPSSSDHPNKAFILIGNRNKYDPITLQHYDGFYAQIKKAYNNLSQRLYTKMNETSIKFSDLDCKTKNNFRKKYFPINIIYDDNYKTNEKPQNSKASLTPEVIEIVDNKKEVAEGFVKENKKERINNTTEIPFAVVENVPAFLGCEIITDNQERKKCTSEKVNTFINKQFDKHIASKLGLTKQRIWCTFKINVNGGIENIRVRASHPDLKNEAIRIIKSLPKFVPGKQNGINVIVSYSLPFVIN